MHVKFCLFFENEVKQCFDPDEEWRYTQMTVSHVSTFIPYKMTQLAQRTRLCIIILRLQLYIFYQENSAPDSFRKKHGILVLKNTPSIVEKYVYPCGLCPTSDW